MGASSVAAVAAGGCVAAGTSASIISTSTPIALAGRDAPEARFGVGRRRDAVARRTRQALEIPIDSAVSTDVDARIGGLGVELERDADRIGERRKSRKATRAMTCGDARVPVARPAGISRQLQTRV